MARLGGWVTPGLLGRARVAVAQVTARLNAVFADADLLLTPALAAPPLRLGAWEGCGALRTLLGASRFTPFTPAWNVTGQPAASVPAGLDNDGLPLAVQLVAREHEEATLLSLAAQLEAERPWADRRPPLP
jgi:amidase